MEETSAGSDILGGLFGLLGKKIDQQTAAQVATANSASTWAGNNPNIAVDEFGRPYLRGAPSNTSPLGVSPVVWVIAAAALAGLLFALKR